MKRYHGNLETIDGLVICRSWYVADEADERILKAENDAEDAARYRFLRDRAVQDHSLEGFVALGQADFISSERKFDAWIDREMQARKDGDT